MTEHEARGGENSRAGKLNEVIKRTGIGPLAGSGLEGTLLDASFEVNVAKVFSEWLSKVVKEPSRLTAEMHLQELIGRLKSHLSEFQFARDKHDYLASLLPEYEEPKDSGLLDID